MEDQVLQKSRCYCLDLTRGLIGLWADMRTKHNQPVGPVGEVCEPIIKHTYSPSLYSSSQTTRLMFNILQLVADLAGDLDLDMMIYGSVRYRDGRFDLEGEALRYRLYVA